MNEKESLNLCTSAQEVINFICNPQAIFLAKKLDKKNNNGSYINFNIEKIVRDIQTILNKKGKQNVEQNYKELRKDLYNILETLKKEKSMKEKVNILIMDILSNKECTIIFNEKVQAFFRKFWYEQDIIKKDNFTTNNFFNLLQWEIFNAWNNLFELYQKKPESVIQYFALILWDKVKNLKYSPNWNLISIEKQDKETNKYLRLPNYYLYDKKPINIIEKVQIEGKIYKVIDCKSDEYWNHSRLKVIDTTGKTLRITYNFLKKEWKFITNKDKAKAIAEKVFSFFTK